MHESWLLVIGCWLLGAGRLSVVGCWLLGAGGGVADAAAPNNQSPATNNQLPATSNHHLVAFQYAPIAPQQLDWFGRFDVLVTHDPLPRAQVEALHARGTKLVLYEWSVAFYRSLVRRGSFQERMLTRHSALLNRQPLRGHLGAADADAFYYDPATREHRDERAKAIAARLRQIGYDGVFLDTTTVQSVHPAALVEYKRRHPDTPYDAAFARFLRSLRRELHGGLIVTNQGFRDASHYLPYADYDVAESLITWPRNGGIEFRPRHDPNDLWNSTDFLMRNLIEPARKKYPRVQFVQLNYTNDPKDVPQIVAIARQFGCEAFVANPDVTAIESDAYFAREKTLQHAVP